jgi:predicted RecB family nuclease
MRSLAESLIESLGTEGPVLMYTTYEQRVIRGLAALLPDLARDLEAILERLVDLHPVVKSNYYHPDMLGSWSLKAVLPTIAPDIDYAALEEIQDGTAASNAYLEAIDPDTPAERREQIRDRLLEYCRLDSEAMVRLVRFLGGDQNP